MVSGASGLVGSALVSHLEAEGYTVTRLVRRPPKPGEVRWDPERGELDPAALDGAVAIVHLAGDNVGNGRWTAEKKRSIEESRTRSTRLLARTAAAASARPDALVCASAVGIYGSRADELLDEDSSHGEGFLASVCEAWEASAAPAREAGIRTAHLRLGVVLAAHDGALAKMLPPFRAGVGGRVGSGEQYMAWISLRDAVRVFARAVSDAAFTGVINVVAPAPVKNKDFTKALGRVLGRPTLIPVPAVALRALFGEMADATVLASQRVVPRKLEALGFAFNDRDIEPALRSVLARSA